MIFKVPIPFTKLHNAESLICYGMLSNGFFKLPKHIVINKAVLIARVIVYFDVERPFLHW